MFTCLGTIVVIGREAGWKWAAFSVTYQITVAWCTCFVFYQIARLFL